MSARIPSGGQAATGVGAAEVSWVGLLVIFCLGINLRPILTGIGPLLEEITAGTGLGFQGASLLTVLPVLCMGLVALLLPWLAGWPSTAASSADCWPSPRPASGAWNWIAGWR